VSLISEEDFPVMQIKAGRFLLACRKEKTELSVLNMAAAEKAKQSNDFESAHSLLETGVELLSENCWETDYDLALDIHVALAKSAYLTGHLERMDEITEIVLENAGSLLDRIRIHEIILDGCIARNRMDEAITNALLVLKFLNIKIPENPKTFHVLSYFLKTKFLIGFRSVETLIKLEAMKKPEKLAAMRILQKIGTASYCVTPQLTPFLMFNMVGLSVRYGNAPESSFAYLSYGLFLCGVLGDIDKGYRTGTAAIELMEKREVFQYRARIIQTFTCTIRHWKKPLQTMIEPLMKARRWGFETGDFEYSALSALFQSITFFFAGNRLDQVVEVMKETRNYILKLGQESALPQQAVFYQAVLNLTSKSQSPCRLSGIIHDEEKMFLICQASRQPHILNHFYLNKLMLCIYFRDYNQAFICAQKAEQTLDSVVSLTNVPWIHFFGSLAKLSVLDKKDKATQKHLLKEVGVSLKKMKNWAFHCPENYLHKYLLIKAEVYRVAGEIQKAASLYPKAANLAKANGYINEYALTNELAARFCFAGNENRSAACYLENAFEGYQQWGGIAKIWQLRQLFPGVLKKNTVSTGCASDVPFLNISRHAGADIDLSSVLKMNQAISREINYDRLCQILVTLLMENAGAEKTVLVVVKSGKLVVEAIGYADKEAVCLMPSVPVEETDSLCFGIVRYTVRQKIPLVIHDASTDPFFGTDPYVRQSRPLSILCVPMILRSVITGVLYLENNLVSHAFKTDRVRIISMLSSQMAISIENARLYSEKDEQGKIINDINTRLEREIQERSITEKKYQTIFENAAEGIFQISGAGKMITVNPTFVQMLEYDSKKDLMDLTEKSIHALFVKNGDLIKLLSLIRSKKQIQGFHTQLVTKGKNYLPVMINARLSTFSDTKIDFFEGSIIDLTQQQKVEKWKLATVKAEVAAKTKNSFFANMSHEIRTLLNSVVVFSQLACKTTETGRQKFYMENIRSSAEILGQLVNQILDFSKIEANRLELEERPFYLPDLLSKLAAIFLNQIKEKGLGFHVNVDENVQHHLGGDAFRLNQVLMNIINNAVKFTDQGEISVNVSRRDSAIQGQELIVFCVSDTGTGIKPNMLKTLFDPYVQEDSGISRQYGGTGLGLTICKKIVEMMGGSIQVDSTPGKGSTFCFTALFRQVLDSQGIVDLKSTEASAAVCPDKNDTLIMEDTISISSREQDNINDKTVYLLEELDRMLAVNNFKAWSCFEKLKQKIPTAVHEPIFLEFETHMKNFDFKAARTNLADLTRQLASNLREPENETF